MIRIKSNIKDAVARMTRFQENLDVELEEITTPSRWVDTSNIAAEAALQSMAESDAERAFIPRFMATVKVSLMGNNGMKWEMSKPDMGGVDVFSAIVANETGDLFALATAEQRSQVYDVLLEFVQTEKRIDERDSATYSAEQIARDLYQMMFGRRSVGRLDATARLLPHIQEFAARQGVAMTEEKVSAWLNEVLRTWADTIQEQLPDALSKAVDEAWKGRK